MLLAPSAAPASGYAATLDEWIGEDGIISRRVAAIAVMSLLAFGVLLGAVVGPGAGLSPVYVLPSSQQAAALTPEEPAAAAAAEAVPLAEETAEAPVEAPLATAPTGSVAKVNHVWLIVLSDQGYAKTFGDLGSSSYLISDLAAKGAVVPNYYAVAQGELANSVALVSGQGPTWQQTQNCANYTDVTPGTIDATTGQATGDGCVFPDTVRTIGNAMEGAGKTWGVYAEDIDNGLNGRATPCRQPTAGAPDPDHATDAINAYASWGNPFMYFKAVAASPNCQFQMSGLKTMEADLTAARSPAFSMVIPNRCHSGSDAPCRPGAPAGLASSDEFLRDVTSKIMASKDYLDGGLIAITFDQAPQGVPGADVSACCSQPTFPNLALAPAAPTPAGPSAPTGPTGSSGATGKTGGTGETGPTGSSSATGTTGEATPTAPAGPSYVKTLPTGEPAGGGKVGLLLLSPLVKAGSADVADDYNHFSLLLSIENWFATEKLGYTAQIGLGALPDSLFSAPAAK
jgi:hypothetical protein